jgi:hypothetical protein
MGDKRVRSVPITIRTALQSALSASDPSDQPIIYEVAVKYVEVFGQIDSINYDSSSLVCVVDDGTGKIHLKQYFGMSPQLSFFVYGFVEQPIVGEDEESPFAQLTYAPPDFSMTPFVDRAPLFGQLEPSAQALILTYLSIRSGRSRLRTRSRITSCLCVPLTLTLSKKRTGPSERLRCVLSRRCRLVALISLRQLAVSTHLWMQLLRNLFSRHRLSRQRRLRSRCTSSFSPVSLHSGASRRVIVC